nr:tRNA lysidine(34) synthetase TilS [Lachnospiraceae bacterium]
VIYEMIGMTAGLKKDITSTHVGIVYDLLFTDGSKELSLPYGILVRKEYNRLYFIKRDEEEAAMEVQQKDGYDPDDDLEEEEYEGDANTPGRTRELPQINHRILTKFDLDNIPTGNYTKWFDCDKISKACTLRYRRKGDYLTINSEMGKKSLQDYMVNEKIPKKDRDRVPLVADGSHIMWVVGHRMSEYYKVTKDTKKVLEVTVRI